MLALLLDVLADELLVEDEEELELLLELVEVLEEVLLEVEPPDVRVCADISGAAIAIAIKPAVKMVAIFFISQCVLCVNSCSTCKDNILRTIS